MILGQAQGSNKRTRESGHSLPRELPTCKGLAGLLSVPRVGHAACPLAGPHPSGLLQRWLFSGPAPPFSLPSVSLPPVIEVQLAGWLAITGMGFLPGGQVLLEQLDRDGGCRRGECFQALRQMKEDVWCPGT